MAPNYGKRKRGDRNYSQDSHDGSNRPSPHRPGNLNLAQQNQHHSQMQNGRGGRRRSRGGQGGNQSGSPSAGPNSQPSSTRTSPTISHAMSPPSLQSRGPPETQPPVQNRPSNSNDAHALNPATPPKAPASEYYYQYITEELVQSWRRGENQVIIEQALEACREDNAIVLSTMFQELLRSGLDGRISPEDAGSAIKEILSNEASIGSLDTPSVFVDSISTTLDQADRQSPKAMALIASSGVPPAVLLGELDGTELIDLGLVRGTFIRMQTRKTTGLLYRQANYNLLREETEGYSKLVTEYFTTSNSLPPTGEVVEETFLRVKALIGAFDLDVGRVIDITLDVFANLLVKHRHFFIKFLRTSSWWPTAESFDNIKWRDQGLGSLPSWASPESSQWDRWEITEEEKERLSALRQLRDAEFWDRVREVGMAAFFELDGRRITNYDAIVDQLDQEVVPEIDKAGNESYREKTVRKVEDLKWMKETRSLPPSGNPDAAQLLGFKLRFYASPARDASDTLPDNLIYLAALLIKVGFISLRDLYPHLYPHDDKMAEVQEKLMREKAEREKLSRPGGGARNALAMAGALADDTLPGMGRPRDFTSNRGAAVKPDGAAEKSGATPAKVDEEKKDELPEPTDQKISLLKSLLCIGAIPESLYMLGKFPWLPDVLPDLPEYVHRIAHHMLSKVYEPARPLRDRSSVQVAKKQVADQAGQPKGILRLADPPSRKTLRWAQLDRGDMGDGVAYRFYWDDWTDNVPICQTVNDVFQLCGTFLNYSGVKIGQDPTLLTKLTRIGKKSLSDDPSKENHARWIDLSKRLLVPALSLTKNNPGVVNEMFDLLKCFSIATRYSIYAEWYSGQISRLPDIKAAFDQARAETKDVLKRISKDNTKSMARALAKVAYASPGIVFSVAINQMEAYDNLIEVVVECARYFTYLGYDVLTWSLMSALGGRGRDRVQADGMLTSSWLKALSLFAGRVFKRYSVMSPSPILQYVTNELRLGNSTDLEVLEQIVSTMAGIPSDMTFNEAQTMAMAGGEALQAQTLLQLGDRRHQSKLSARRLMRSLTEPGLAGQLLISIAQERQTYIHHESSNAAPLKVLGNNLDKIHQVFAHYLDMLRSNLSTEEFDAAIPGVVSLISEFGIEPSIAFAISRPSIAQAIAVVDTAAESEKQSRRLSTEKAQVDRNVELADDSTKAPTDEGEKAASQNGTPTKQESSPKNEEETSSEMKDIPQVADATSTSTPGPIVNGVHDPWHPVLKPLMESLRPILREDFESTLSLPFYTTFWTLALHDMVVFSNTYETEIKKHVTALGKINSDRTDLTTLGMKKKEHEKKSINEVLDRLRGEMRTQIQAYQQVRTRINKEKDHWFTGFVGKSEALCNAIIQDCFYPRILLSPLDAFYTFQMLRFLHSSGALGFGTMRVMDRILSKQLTALMFQCTSREADNFGRFLNELLKELSTWHADRAVYEKIAYGPKRNLPGFAKKLSAGKVVEFLDFEEFRRLMFKWHGNLNNAFKACFSGGEYMHIRNSIIVLKAVHQSFPVVNFMGKSIFESVTELSESEKREDLKLAATSLLGDLKRREKAWVLPQAFRQVSMSMVAKRTTPTKATKGDTASTAQKPVGRSTSVRPETPQRDSGKTNTLNAAAAEFKPKPSSLANGTANNAASGKGDAEDGEIEDTKMADAEAKADVEVQLTTPSKSAESEKPASDQVDEAEDKLSAPAVIQPAPPHTVTESPDSKPSTPAPIPAATASQRPPSQGFPPRPDINRTPSSQSIANRLPHSLPSRPDSHPPPRRMPDRPGDRPGDRHLDSPNPRQDGRGPGPQDFGRLDRPGDIMRDNFGTRRDPSDGRRSRARTPERLPPPDVNRRDPGYSGRIMRDVHPDDQPLNLPSRDARPPPHDAGRPPNDRDRGFGLRPSGPPTTMEGRGRINPQPSMAAPPSNDISRPDRSGYANPERANFLPQQAEKTGPQPARSQQAEDQAGMTPARAAIKARLSRIELNQQNPSPNQQPAWGPDDRPSASNMPPRRDGPQDERFSQPERPPLPNLPPMHRDRRDQPGSNAPTGPRSGRPGQGDGSDHFSSAPSRELFDPMNASRPPPNVQRGRLGHSFVPPRQQESTHGRLSQNFGPPRPQQDPDYGRLNSGNDVPSGPRGHAGPPRGARNFTAPQPQVNSRQNESSAQTQMTSSPSSQRQPQNASYPDRRDRGPAPFDRLQPTQSSAPPTSVNEQGPSELSGIHPSRLSQVQPPPLRTDLNNVGSPAIHAPSPGSAGPMSGSRGPPGPSAGTPTGPWTASRSGPPSGPSSVVERRRGGGDSKRLFAGLQDTLQQNDVGSIRGRAGRQASSTMPPLDVSQHTTPVTPRLDGFPPRVDSRPDNAPSSRADLFQGRNGIGPGNSDFEPQDNRSDSRDGRRREDGPGDGERRSDKQRISRDGSRDHQEDKYANRRPDLDRGFRSDEHRERRSERNGDGSDRDSRGGRHSGRDREQREGGSSSRQGGGMDDGPRAGPPPSTHNSFSHAHANRDPSDSRQQGRNNGAGAEEARPGQTGYSGPSQGLGRKNQDGHYQGSQAAEGLGYRGNDGGGNGRFDSRNGDASLRPDGGHGGQRRDDRDDGGRDRRVDGRDVRKRRADEGSMHGDSKRLRRSGP